MEHVAAIVALTVNVASPDSGPLTDQGGSPLVFVVKEPSTEHKCARDSSVDAPPPESMHLAANEAT